MTADQILQWGRCAGCPRGERLEWRVLKPNGEPDFYDALLNPKGRCITIVSRSEVNNEQMKSRRPEIHDVVRDRKERKEYHEKGRADIRDGLRERAPRRPKGSAGGDWASLTSADHAHRVENSPSQRASGPTASTIESMWIPGTDSARASGEPASAGYTRSEPGLTEAAIMDGRTFGKRSHGTAWAQPVQQTDHTFPGGGSASSGSRPTPKPLPHPPKAKYAKSAPALHGHRQERR